MTDEEIILEIRKDHNREAARCGHDYEPSAAECDRATLLCIAEDQSKKLADMAAEIERLKKDADDHVCSLDNNGR